MAFDTAGSSRITLARWNGLGWDFEDVTSGLISCGSLKIDPSFGRPALSFRSIGPRFLRYAIRNP